MGQGIADFVAQEGEPLLIPDVRKDACWYKNISEDLPIFGPRTAYQDLQVGLTLNEAINRFKKEFIIANLRHTGGNRTKAAKKMNIQRTYLSRLISKYNIR